MTDTIRYLGEFAKGDACRARVWFLDADGFVATPTTVTVVVRQPDGTQNTYTYSASTTDIETDGAAYYRDLQLTSAGIWRLKWSGTITDIGVRVVEQYLTVLGSSIT